MVINLSILIYIGLCWHIDLANFGVVIFSKIDTGLGVWLSVKLNIISYIRVSYISC